MGRVSCSKLDQRDPFGKNSHLKNTALHVGFSVCRQKWARLGCLCPQENLLGSENMVSWTTSCEGHCVPNILQIDLAVQKLPLKAVASCFCYLVDLTCMVPIEPSHSDGCQIYTRGGRGVLPFVTKDKTNVRAKFCQGSRRRALSFPSNPSWHPDSLVSSVPLRVN